MSEYPNQNRPGDGSVPNGQPWDQNRSPWDEPQSSAAPAGGSPQAPYPGAVPQDPYAGAGGQDPYQASATPGAFGQQPPAPYDGQGYAAPAPGYGYQPYGYVPMAPAYASFGKRVQGWLLDWLLPSVILNTILQLLVPSLHDTSNPRYDPSTNWPSLVVFLVNALVLAFIMKDGQTPGRRWARTRLVDQNGQPLQGGAAALPRYLLHILDEMCFLGWLWPLWDSKRQTFADKLAKTYVVDETSYGQQPPQQWQ